MARHLQHQEAEPDPQLSIDSLIDVAFLLLIYFLVTTSLQETEADLEIQLPSVDTSTSEKLPPVPPLSVRIMSNGDVVANPGKPEEERLDLGSSGRDLPQLRNLFESYQALARSQPDAEPVVIIDPDQSVPSQRFVDVVNEAVGVEIQNISFTIFPSEDSA